MFIKEIYESDIWLPTTAGVDFATVPTRMAVRGVVKNSEGKIAVITYDIYNGAALPWWAVDGQWLEEAFKREIREEVGANITDIQPLGIVREYRVYHDKPVINHTVVFSASVTGELMPLSLSEDEQKEWHAVNRVTLDEAKSLLRSALLEEPSYGAAFVLNRELMILEEYTTFGGGNSKMKDAEEIAKKAQYDYIMLKSEFDSYVRRMESDEKEGKVGALIDVAKKLLPIVDQLGQSVSHIPADLDSNTRAQWVKLTYDNAVKTLQGLGISQIPTIGEEPNIELHEPLSVEPTDDEALKGKIIREFQPGYIYEKNGTTKVISAAKVIVGQ